LKETGKPFVSVVTHAESLPVGSSDVVCRQSNISVNALDPSQRDAFLTAFKTATEKLRPTLSRMEHILDGLVSPNDWVLHVVPIDSQAPKGRLILPQVMTLRNALDSSCRNIVVTEKNFEAALADMKTAPALVVCDSQVVEKVMAVLPDEIPCTTYSILMARMKGGLAEMAEGAMAISKLRDGDRILIAEVCAHHAGEDDIGRVKIPNLLKRKTGKALEFDFMSGRDFADDAKRYALIVHCGGCMATREQISARIAQAKAADVPITNYGVCIAHAQGVLQRALKPFSELDGHIKKTVYQIWAHDYFDYQNVDEGCSAIYTDREEAEKELQKFREEAGENSIVKFGMRIEDMTSAELREFCRRHRLEKPDGKTGRKEF